MNLNIFDGLATLASSTAVQVTAPPAAQFYEHDNFIGMLAVGGGLAVGMIAIIFGTLTGVAKRKALEESRREIAAYVAEGSISPQDAERLLKAGKAC